MTLLSSYNVMDQVQCTVNTYKHVRDRQKDLGSWYYITLCYIKHYYIISTLHAILLCWYYDFYIVMYISMCLYTNIVWLSMMVSIEWPWYIYIYINHNISKVKKHRVWERYDSVLWNLMWFKYNKRKSSGSYNRRVWVDILTLRAGG